MAVAFGQALIVLRHANGCNFVSFLFTMAVIFFVFNCTILSGQCLPPFSFVSRLTVLCFQDRLPTYLWPHLPLRPPGPPLIHLQPPPIHNSIQYSSGTRIPLAYTPYHPSHPMLSCCSYFALRYAFYLPAFPGSIRMYTRTLVIVSSDICIPMDVYSESPDVAYSPGHAAYVYNRYQPHPPCFSILSIIDIEPKYWLVESQ